MFISLILNTKHMCRKIFFLCLDFFIKAAWIYKQTFQYIGIKCIFLRIYILSFDRKCHIHNAGIAQF